MAEGRITGIWPRLMARLKERTANIAGNDRTPGQIRLICVFDGKDSSELCDSTLFGLRL
jgi:hypothetical protein